MGTGYGGPRRERARDPASPSTAALGSPTAPAAPPAGANSVNRPPPSRGGGRRRRAGGPAAPEPAGGTGRERRRRHVAEACLARGRRRQRRGPGRANGRRAGRRVGETRSVRRLGGAGRPYAVSRARCRSTRISLARVLFHRLVDEVVDGALELLRHLLKGVPENVATLECTGRLLIGIRGHEVSARRHLSPGKAMEERGVTFETMASSVPSWPAPRRISRTPPRL